MSACPSTITATDSEASSQLQSLAREPLPLDSETTSGVPFHTHNRTRCQTRPFDCRSRKLCLLQMQELQQLTGDSPAIGGCPQNVPTNFELPAVPAPTCSPSFESPWIPTPRHPNGNPPSPGWSECRPPRAAGWGSRSPPPPSRRARPSSDPGHPSRAAAAGAARGSRENGPSPASRCVPPSRDASGRPRSPGGQGPEKELHGSEGQMENRIYIYI